MWWQIRIDIWVVLVWRRNGLRRAWESLPIWMGRLSSRWRRLFTAVSVRKMKDGQNWK